MALGFLISILLISLTFRITTAAELVVVKDGGRQMEHISLLKALLQQTELLSSVDGVLLAFTTLLVSLATRIKPMLLASAMSFTIYTATALLMPVPLANAALSRMGLPPLPMVEGRSIGGPDVPGKIITNLVAQARFITINPVMTIVTNVSVNVIEDAMSRIGGVVSRMLVQQLASFGRNVMAIS